MRPFPEPSSPSQQDEDASHGDKRRWVILPADNHAPPPPGAEDAPPWPPLLHAAATPETDGAIRARLLRNVASGAAHDMANLLCVMGFSFNVLASEPLSLEAEQALASIRAESTYLLGLARELQLAARDADAPRVQERTRLTAWWPDARTLLRGMAGDNAIVTATIPWGLPSVGLSPQSLTQIVLNLVGNAVHAIEDERSACQSDPARRSARPGRISISAERRTPLEPSIQLSVADNGPGMSAQSLSRAFERAYTTRADRGGSGMGLFMAQRMVEGAGGRISIASKSGEGTTVTLELPTRIKSEPLAQQPAAG